MAKKQKNFIMDTAYLVTSSFFFLQKIIQIQKIKKSFQIQFLYTSIFIFLINKPNNSSYTVWTPVKYMLGYTRSDLVDAEVIYSTKCKKKKKRKPVSFKM